jgi:hypothetical protein
MCIDLTGAGDFHFDLVGWCFALELGQQYGWEPEVMIAQKADDAAAPGGYPEPFAWYARCVGKAGGRVSAADARRWADALERALADIPDHDARTRKPQAFPMPAALARLLSGLPGVGRPDPGRFVTALEWFSRSFPDANRQRIVEVGRTFVRHCIPSLNGCGSRQRSRG